MRVELRVYDAKSDAPQLPLLMTSPDLLTHLLPEEKAIRRKLANATDIATENTRSYVLLF